MPPTASFLAAYSSYLESIKREQKSVLQSPSRDQIIKYIDEVQKLDILLKQVKAADSSIDIYREALGITAEEFALSLHKEKSKTEYALYIVNFLSGEFGDIPSLHNKLHEDTTYLSRQLDFRQEPFTTKDFSKDTIAKKASFRKWLIPSIVIVIVALVTFVIISVRSNPAHISTELASTSIAFTPKPITPTPTIIPTAKPTAKPTATPTIKPTSTPRPIRVSNGQILIDPDYVCTCPFTINAPKGANCYVYLKFIKTSTRSLKRRMLEMYPSESYESDIAFYVAAGRSAEIKVPIGVYEFYYATGQTYYGKKLLFGNTTSYFKSDELLEFYLDNKDYYIGHTITLYSVENGNFDTDQINETLFPTRDE